MIRIATAAAFSEIAGRILSGESGLTSGCCWSYLRRPLRFASFCLARLPSRPLVASGGTHPFRALRFVRDDALFRRTLVMWMLMGFANLMILPLRVEYLANPKYGVTWDGRILTTAQIALLVGVIPNLARLVMSPVWGWLFDRMNFFVLRIVLNAGFALGMLSFFGGNHLAWLIVGAIIYGISNGGGDVAWGLWVTKFAPPERVADYMSVHTFFTGLRGVLAPMVAFQLVAHWSVAAISWLGAGMIVAATLLLIPEIKFGRNARPGGGIDGGGLGVKMLQAQLNSGFGKWTGTNPEESVRLLYCSRAAQPRRFAPQRVVNSQPKLESKTQPSLRITGSSTNSLQ